jgi:hypothetical protein
MNSARIIQTLREFPNTAAKMVAVFAEHPGSQLNCGAVAEWAGLGTHEAVHVPAVMDVLLAEGVCRQQGPGTFAAACSGADLNRLAAILEGAALYRSAHRDADKVEIVLTMPARPSRLETALPAQGPSYVRLRETDSVFTDVARAARARFVIMSPFLDEVGVQWAMRLFEATRGRTVERIIILRDYERALPLLYAYEHLIDQLGVRIFDYRVGHQPGERVLEIETFHAKILLADREQAYVGSANMLESSKDFSLECGIHVAGPSARQVALLVNAVISVSVSRR